MQAKLNKRHLILIISLIMILIFGGLIYITIGTSGDNQQNQLSGNTNEIPETSQITQQEPAKTATDPAEIPVTALSLSDDFPIMERDEITITIEDVFLDTDTLHLTYEIHGLPANMFSPERIDALSTLSDDEPLPDHIRLPDNAILKIQSGSICEGAGDLSTSWMTCNLIFPALPENINSFTLEIDRLNNALPGEFPEKWEIPIPMPQVNESAYNDFLIREPNLCSQEIENISFCLLETTQSAQESNFNFAISIQLEENNAYLQEMSPITLTNAKGQYHILTGGQYKSQNTLENSQFTSLFSLATGPIDDSEFLTFHLNWITLNFNDAKPLNFSPQRNASIGQEWNINQSIQFAGYSLDILKARLKTKTETELTYEFEIKMSDELSDVSVSSNASSMSYGSVFDADRNILLGRLTIPSDTDEEIQFYISHVIVKIKGPWVITWQPSKVEFSESYQTKVVPTRMALEIDPLQSDNTSLIELSDLINQTYSKYNQPGWIVQKMERESTETNTLLGSRDSITVPPQTNIETWMHLDENGFIDTRIIIIKTMDDEILTINIDKDNIHFSLPEGRSSIGQDIYMEKPSFDLNAISIINGYLQENGQLTKTTTKLGSMDCLLYKATRPYNPPIDFTNHPIPVTEMIVRIWINPQTGQILQKQNTIIYEDGTSVITETSHTISVEIIQTLPPQIQTILDSLIIP